MIKKYNFNQSFQIPATTHTVLISSYDPHITDYLVQNIARIKEIDVLEKVHIQQLKDWDNFLQQHQNYSLFSEKKLIEINIEKSALPHKEFPKLQPLEDEFYILKTSVFKHSFLNHLEQNKNCLWLGIYSPSRQELWQWLSNQLSKLKYTLAPNTYEWFFQLQTIDFSLCQQMLEKIQLQFPEPTEINPQLLSKQLGFYSEDDWQPLLEAWIQKDIHKMTQLLKIAKTAQQDLSLLIWLLNRTLQVWYALLENKQSKQTIFQHFKIWQNHIPLYEKSTNNHPIKNVEKMMVILQEVDELYKNYQQNLAWIKLEKLFYCQFIDHAM